ncbi:unnamed protein product [Rotaria sp. Silwood2]|nr:unnamed protein product [Rotaria sp. Silwood2]
MVVTPIIVAYFTAWSIYQRSYIVTDIPGDKITHINYAFANIGSDGRIALGDSWADIEKANDTIMLNHLNVNIQQSSDQWLTLQSNGTYNLFTNILINNSKR